MKKIYIKFLYFAAWTLFIGQTYVGVIYFCRNANAYRFERESIYIVMATMFWGFILILLYRSAIGRK